MRDTLSQLLCVNCSARSRVASRRSCRLGQLDGRTLVVGGAARPARRAGHCPRGGRERRLVAEVRIHNPQRGNQRMNHITVVWGKPAPARSAPIRRLQLDNLPSRVIDVASGLFNDQHYESAVSEAFKSLEDSCKGSESDERQVW